jgi:hypothetical protein
VGGGRWAVTRKKHEAMDKESSGMPHKEQFAARLGESPHARFFLFIVYTQSIKNNSQLAWVNHRMLVSFFLYSTLNLLRKTTEK